MRRLFFALWPQAAVRAALDQMRCRAAHLPGRRVGRRNLHLTLEFLGQRDDADLKRAMAAARMLEFAPFCFVLDQVEWFRRAKVLVAGAYDPAEPLLALRAMLHESLRQQGLRLEARDWRPHVTFMRDCRGPWRPFQTNAVRWKVSDFCLVESRPAYRDVVYRVRRRFPCKPAGQRIFMPAPSMG